MSDAFTRADAIALVDDWLAYYPTDIFPPLRPEERGKQVSRDRVSAHAIRHVMTCLRGDIENWEPE